MKCIFVVRISNNFQKRTKYKQEMRRKRAMPLPAFDQGYF
jgi:hypothetical protein